MIPWNRSPEEFARIYGSKERVEWVKDRPCFGRILASMGYDVGPCQGAIENCHTATGGTSYKAGYETITAGCHRHHEMLDRYKRPFDMDRAREYIRRLAAITQAAWIARQL